MYRNVWKMHKKFSNLMFYENATIGCKLNVGHRSKAQIAISFNIIIIFKFIWYILKIIKNKNFYNRKYMRCHFVFYF